MKVNGKELAVQAGTTLETFLKEQGYDLSRIAVERNMEIVPKREYEQVFLNEDDSLEVVSFVGGG